MNCFGGNCSWILIIILLLVCCCGNNGFGGCGCGCNNNNCGCGAATMTADAANPSCIKKQAYKALLFCVPLNKEPAWKQL